MPETRKDAPWVESIDSPLGECIHKALEAYSAREPGNRLESLDLCRAIKRPYSCVAIFQVRTLSWTRRLVSKTILPHPFNRRILARKNQAVVEYEILNQLQSAFRGVEGCSVPQPVLVIPELETYVMEYVEAAPLADQMRYVRRFSSTVKFTALRHHFFLCGRWLRHFHRATGVRVAGSEALSELQERCHDVLGRIGAVLDRREWRSLRDRVTKELACQSDRMRSLGVLVSGHHGDFGPWNILAGTSGITVIDFVGHQEMPLPIDILDVLLGLEVERRCLTTSPKRIDMLRAAFLKGYGDFPAVPEPLLVICEMWHRLGRLEDCLVLKGGKLHHRFERRLLLKEHVAWFTYSQSRKLTWPGRKL